MTERYLFRYRRIDNLFGRFNELEKQSIYFASAEQQNDPMEGLLDIRWKGDAILWRNLVLHYFRCLYIGLSQLQIGGAETEIALPVFVNSTSFPNLERSATFRYAKAKMLASCDLRLAIRDLGRRSRETGRNEFLCLLYAIHAIALKAISVAFAKAGHPIFTAEMPSGSDSLRQQIKTMDSFLERNPQSFDRIEVLQRKMAGMFSEMAFIAEYNMKSKTPIGARAVSFEFPLLYISALRKLVHSGSYAACFSENASNSSMWSHYTNKHEGVCLIFRSAHEGRRITLNGITGSAGDQNGIRNITGQVSFEFYPVDYDSRHPTIDFFKTLGGLPLPIIEQDWFSSGRTWSAERDHLKEIDTDEWRSAYWDQVIKNATIKSTDWRYEKELRLILPSLLGEKSDEERTLTYEFADLYGIIFGINTSVAHKIEICGILEKKCRAHGRTDFKFFQAFYDPASGLIDREELDFLKFDIS